MIIDEIFLGSLLVQATENECRKMNYDLRTSDGDIF